MLFKIKKREIELIIANKELFFQNQEKRNRADELIIANKELAFQNQEKKNRADELIIANKELAFQNQEKQDRADELIIANKELAFQNQEKRNRADELIIANKELAFQFEEKIKGVNELVISLKKLTFQQNRADDLKITNQELIDAKEQLQLLNVQKTAILNALPANIALINTDGVIISVNQAWAEFGSSNGSKSGSENIGDNYLSVSESSTGNDEKSAKQIVAGIRAVLAGTIEKFMLEYPCHSPDEQRWFQVRVTPSQDEIINGAVIMHLNITEKKLHEIQKEKLMEDVVQRNKNLEQFSYIISHNLRLPVANIIGLTSLLQEANLDKETLDHINNLIIVSADKLDEIIKDLNNILQAKNKITQRKESVNFTNLATDIYLGIETIVKAENAKITWDFSAAPEMITVKSYLHSIFYNLITNSLKYRQQDTNLSIEISSQIISNKIILLFKDNGLGMDLEKDNNMVFELYKRLHSEYAEGKGVGLYMVKTQVETLGGVVSVKSEVNKSTEFRIEFPI